MILLEYEKAVADIKKECSNMKYGIFLSHHEMKKNLKNLQMLLKPMNGLKHPKKCLKPEKLLLQSSKRIKRNILLAFVK